MSQNVSKSTDDYVNLYGAPVRVVKCDETGELLIPLHEVTKLGFNIYKKTQYLPTLIDESQFTEEFNLAILDAARNYMFNNRFRFNERDILQSIENCKRILEGKTATSPIGFLDHRQIKKHDDFDIRITHEIKSAHPKPTATLTTQNLSAHNAGYEQSCSNGIDEQHSKASSNKIASCDGNSSEKLSNISNANSTPKRRGAAKLANGSKAPPQQRRPHLNGLRAGPTHQNGYISSSNQLRSPRENQEKLSNGGSVHNRSAEPSNTIELQLRVAYKVTVCFVKSRTVIFVHDNATNDVLADVMIRVQKEAETQPEVTPVIKKMFIAEEDDMWFRCKVISVNPLRVYFVDYGNVKDATAVKLISDDLSKIPHQAIRVAFKEHEYEPNEEDVINIKPYKRYDDGTYSVNVLSDSQAAQLPTPVTPPSPPQPQPQPLRSSQIPVEFDFIQDGQTVMIMKEENGRLLLRSKDCHRKFLQIGSDLKTIQHVPITNVKAGQLVVCSRDDNTMARALVKDVRGDQVAVDYLDFKDSAQISVDKLFKISDAVAQEPLTYMVSPQICNASAIIPTGRESLRHSIEQSTKFIVVLHNGKFDLKRKNGSLVSVELTGGFDKADRIMMGDMKQLNLEACTEDCLVSYKTLDDVIITPTGDRHVEYVTNLIKQSVDSTIPSSVIAGEVCWGEYEDEVFYRVEILAKLTNDKYSVRLIDFGGSAELMTNQLRKLTDNVRDIPVLGLQCRLIGIKESSIQLKRIGEILKAGEPEQTVYSVNIKSHNRVDNIYEIEIPTIY